jgi:hypothetical protein
MILAQVVEGRGMSKRLTASPLAFRSSRHFLPVGSAIFVCQLGSCCLLIILSDIHGRGLNLLGLALDLIAIDARKAIETPLKLRVSVLRLACIVGSQRLTLEPW